MRNWRRALASGDRVYARQSYNHLAVPFLPCSSALLPGRRHRHGAYQGSWRSIVSELAVSQQAQAAKACRSLLWQHLAASRVPPASLGLSKRGDPVGTRNQASDLRCAAAYLPFELSVRKGR